MAGTTAGTEARAGELLAGYREAIYQRTDRMFAGLLAFQWVVMIALALYVSPLTWAGTASRTHPHVWVAVALGGVVVAPPVLLALVRPGRTSTRFAIAAAQMFSAGLLIHLTGGRIETHFHVFGSLAFLAFYRDWRVLLVAFVVTTLDHYARGLAWPESVYGTTAGGGWRWLEHVGWVVFTDLFLVYACLSSDRDLGRTAKREAELEAAHATVEARNRERTAELWQAEERFRRAFDDAATGMAVAEPTGRFLRVNRALCEMLGYSEAELLATTFQALTHPDDREVSRVRAEWAVRGRIDTYQLEKRYVHKDGRPVWVLLCVSLVRDAAGNPVHFVGQFQDVTERRRTEQSLSLFRALLDRVNESIEVIDPDTGRVLDVNEEGCAAHGCPREEYLTLRVPDFDPDLSAPGAWSRVVDQVRRAGTLTHRGWHQRKDGSRFPIEAHVTHIRLDREYLVAVVRDITERCRAEEEREQYFTLSTCLLLVGGHDGTTRRVNPAWEPVLGFAREELIGHPFLDRVHPDDRAATAAMIARVAAGETVRSFECRCVHKDGSCRTILWDGTAFRDGATFFATGRDITDRKRHEEALRASEELCHGVLDSVLSHIAVLDRTGAIVAVNTAWERFARENGAEGRCDRCGVGTNYLAACHDDREPVDEVSAAVAEGIRSVLAGTKPSFELEYPCCAPGRKRWFVLSVTPLNTARGGAVVAHTDITARKRAEEELAGATSRLRLLLDSSGEGIYGIGTDGRCTFVNRAAAEALGYDPAAIVGRDMHELLHHHGPDGSPYPERDCPIYKAARTGTCCHVSDEVFWRKDGTSFPIEYSSFPMNEGGATVGAVVTFRDISDRLRAEAELQQSRTQLLDAIESLESGFVMYDADERLVTCNTRYKEIYAGAAHAMVPGARYESILRAFCASGGHGASGLSADEWVADRLANYRLTGAPTEQRLKDRWVRVSERRTQDGGVVGLRIDITDLKNAQAAAEAASRAKSEFLANMSHEVRTPMNGILGMTDLLLESDLTPEQRDSVGLVKSSAEALLTVINDILDFSKIEAGKLDLDPLPFSVRDTVGDALKALAARAHVKGLELTCDTHEEVPELVLGDAHRLRQVLTNLVGNAIKFTECGEVVVRCQRVAEPGDHVRLRFSVADTGIGIVPDKLRVVFEPFTQADGSTTRRYGGTGLGLTICQRLVALMGGRVWAESEPGKGSTFSFEVRLGRASGSLSRAVEAPIDLKGVAVLIVDDNATNRRVLAETVRHWGARPTCAASGPEALDELRHAVRTGAPFPLVLLDGMMPVMDGFTVAERVGRDPALAGAAVVMLTSADRQGDAARCRELGVSAYLVKPVKPAELNRAIAAALRAPAAARSAPRARPRPAAPQAPTRALRILVVEDNTVNQQVIVRLLEKFGHSVVVAGNGALAVAALDREPFDLVLMDVQMPEMDGFEATQLIRQREDGTGRRTPVVAMTAHAMKGDRERCLASGMDDYVSKPVQRAELIRVLNRTAAGAPGGSTPPSGAVPTPPPREPPPAFDRASAVERLGGDEELFAEVAGVFRGDAPKMMSELRRVVAAGDAPAVQRVAHGLKGAAGYVGGRPTADAALALEKIGAAGDLTDAPGALERLAAEVERLTAGLAQLPHPAA